MANILGAAFALAFCFGFPLGAMFLSDALRIDWIRYVGITPFIVLALLMLLGAVHRPRSYDDDVPGD